MAKQLHKQSMQFESDHRNCMGGLISLFNFRTGRPILRFISDTRHRSGRHAIGRGYPRTGRNLLANGNQKQKGTGAGTNKFSNHKESKTKKVGSDKTSVKVLIDEEMSRLQPSRKQTTRATNEKMGFNSRREGHLRVNRRQTNKTYSMICNQHPNNLGPSAHIDHHQSNHPESNGRFLVVEEPGTHKHQILEMHPNLKNKQNSCQTPNSSGQKHDPQHKLHSKVPLKHPIIKKEPGEDTESFLNQKFITAKQHAKDVALHQSKECMDALEILNSNKELFLKFLEDPNSLLMKHIQDLRNAQLEKLSKIEESSSLTQGNENISHKQNGKESMPRFFGRKDKASQLQLKNESSRIVILKPKNSTTIQSSTTLNKSSSSSQSHYTLSNQSESERFASHFSIREITRKLKRSVIESKKKRNPVLRDETQRISNGPQDSRDTTVKPFKTEVSYEPSIGFDQREIGGLYEHQPSAAYGAEISSSSEEENSKTADYHYQRECNIYNEAKKHLAEMLNAGCGGEDLPSGQLPRTLRRILTTSEGKGLPLTSSLGDDKEPRIASSSPYDGQSKSENLSIFKEGESINCSSLSIQTVKNLLLTEDCNQDVEKREHVSRLELFKENVHASKIQEHICSRETSSPRGGMEMIEIVDDLCMEESTMWDLPPEPERRTPIADSFHCNQSTETVEHDPSSEIFAQDLSKEKRAPKSPLVPFSGSHLLIHKKEASETMSEKVERPSPVSVLEPVFTEDAMSPASPQDAKLPMEARVMHFDQCDNLASGTIVPEVKLKDHVELHERNFKYVQNVLEAADLHQNQTIEWKHFPQLLLNPSLFNEIEASSAQSSGEWRLFFDCINEVLKEMYDKFFDFSPWVSFVRPSVRRVPVGKDVVQEVLKGVKQHLIPQFPKTIDEIIGKDIEKCRTWMNLRIDAERISMEMEEIILEELIEETILDCCN